MSDWRHPLLSSAVRKPGRLRILHAAPYLWSGAGRVIADLLDSQRRRHTVALVTSPRFGELRNWPAYERRIVAGGIRHDRIDLFHREAATFWPAVTAMQRAIDRFEPDVIHTHAGTPAAITLLAAQSVSSRVPLVSHFYSWGIGRPVWMNQMDLWAFRQADRVICSALAYRDILVEGGVKPRHLRLIPWGLSIAPDAGARGRSGSRPMTFGTLGRIERRKGQLDLVRAFAQIRRRHPDARLELVGPIAEEAYAREIRAAITRLSLKGAVRLTGHVADPHRYLRLWDAYVSLSSDEGQGLAVLEAMASGVPVVALNAPGVEDYLTHERTGLSLRSRSPRGVAKAVERLLDDSRLATRVATRALAMVRRRYDWTRTVERIEAVYRSLR
jgi:glycosyltransferase involved in cell wall biosynthesis